jgi:hypothetical protein
MTKKEFWNLVSDLELESYEEQSAYITRASEVAMQIEAELYERISETINEQNTDSYNVTLGDYSKLITG